MFIRVGLECLLRSRIACSVGVSESTVSRVLARAGLSKLSDLEPIEPVLRYEHEAPGELLHIDTKKLGCIVRPSHRVPGHRRDSVDGAGWETLFVAIDDHASEPPRSAAARLAPQAPSPTLSRATKPAFTLPVRVASWWAALSSPNTLSRASEMAS